ncbi:hypothetical protein L210DRAFT_3527040 [Boletus edulis BED1]|uniref:Uncharacterized protein n=1 Tax=Boletus edulis BED1 TaxID=1328754 RepID=A0AAD4C440_BOLED|nr:hypothetical protein L210DRAFT_3527040 [Boletus edulis BED1]
MRSDVFFALVEFLLAAFEVTFASVYILASWIVFWSGVVEGIRVERVGGCEGVLCELGFGRGQRGFERRNGHIHITRGCGGLGVAGSCRSQRSMSPIDSSPINLRSKKWYCGTSGANAARHRD